MRSCQECCHPEKDKSIQHAIFVCTIYHLIRTMRIPSLCKIYNGIESIIYRMYLRRYTSKTLCPGKIINCDRIELNIAFLFHRFVRVASLWAGNPFHTIHQSSFQITLRRTTKIRQWRLRRVGYIHVRYKAIQLIACRLMAACKSREFFPLFCEKSKTYIYIYDIHSNNM